jgi:hypothetical protein
VRQDGPVTLNEIVIFLVGFDILMEKRLAQQPVHHARDVAAGFFG